MPSIFDRSLVDGYESIAQVEAETMARRLAAEEGIFGGISSAGALVAALRVAERAENATIVFIVCDRGDRYLSTGVFNEARSTRPRRAQCSIRVCTAVARSATARASNSLRVDFVREMGRASCGERVGQ